MLNEEDINVKSSKNKNKINDQQGFRDTSKSKRKEIEDSKARTFLCGWRVNTAIVSDGGKKGYGQNIGVKVL